MVELLFILHHKRNGISIVYSFFLLNALFFNEPSYFFINPIQLLRLYKFTHLHMPYNNHIHNSIYILYKQTEHAVLSETTTRIYMLRSSHLEIQKTEITLSYSSEHW